MTFKSYIICATPRSGSTLLCDLLIGTDVPGRPASYYRDESVANWCRRLGVSQPDRSSIAFESAYLEAIKDAGQTSNGLLGLRLMYQSLNDLKRKLRLIFPETTSDIALIEEAFGQTLFVHLTREDQVAQAISRLRAEQSGLWHVGADGSARERIGSGGAAVYDGERIGRYEAELVANDAAWQNWFTQNSITPVRLSYEGLSADPSATLARILDELGISSSFATEATPLTRRMSDIQNILWAERYRRERDH